MKRKNVQSNKQKQVLVHSLYPGDPSSKQGRQDLRKIDAAKKKMEKALKNVGFELQGGWEEQDRYPHLLVSYPIQNGADIDFVAFSVFLDGWGQTF